jgi:hypothetical protein
MTSTFTSLYRFIMLIVRIGTINVSVFFYRFSQIQNRLTLKITRIVFFPRQRGVLIMESTLCLLKSLLLSLINHGRCLY